MSEINYYWETIAGFLLKNNVEIYNSLSRPAEEKEIKSLESILNIKLPDEFKESLMIHNGQNENNNFITFVDYQKLLSINEMMEQHKMFCELFENEMVDFIRTDECEYIKRNYIYNNKWLKFTESNSDGLIMDFDPAVKGKIGQIFFRPHDDNPVDKIITETYGGWLKAICEKLESKSYKIKDGEILFDNFTFYD